MDVRDAIHQDVFSKEGPVSRTSGGPEKQEGVDLEDGKRTVKEGPVSRTSGGPEKQEGVDLGGRWTVKEGPVVRT
ncbi:hypothetical protein PR002_g32242 [Phytophthora rubi]|uniref:Uncharacterized protein n=1 Tax=Phytophthora rubi TaxID=129364 RepID=A0A6A3GB85_9STRA|nr:hypothetical protein PR002_g32242 [Phytophthora rubi]